MLNRTILFFVLWGLLLLLGSCNKNQLLNQGEKDWLQKHPDLTVGISPNAPPYEFVNDKGEITGIFIDFLTLVESRIGYKFKKVYQSDFSRQLSDARSRNIDLLIEIQKTDERLQYLNFTPPLVSHAHVIVVRKSEQNINSIDDLTDRNISVVNKYAVQEYLMKNYPQFKLIPQFDDISCLRDVSTGQTDAFICQQAVATYFIEAEGISNLKISGKIEYKNALAIASRKDMAELHTILTKAVNSISNKDKQKIYNKWLSYTVRPYYQEARFWILLLLVILLILTFLVLINLALQRRVKLKTRELNLARESAEDSEYKVRSMFENTLTGFLFFTPDGQIQEANPAAIHILGSPSLEATKKINALTYKPLVDNGFSGEFTKCLTEKRVITNEINYFSKWGKSVYLKYFLIPIIQQNKTIGIWANLQDLTDLWLTQMDLKQAKEHAEESDRLKTAFLANMSHEIRTPMNGILGFADLLKEPGLTGEDQQGYIEVIRKSGTRMLNIINDIIDIAKIESGQMAVLLSDTNINEQTEFIHTFFKPEAETKGIQIRCRNGLPLSKANIKTDTEKVYAILTNLVKNAIKFTDKGSIEFGYVVQQNNGDTELEFYVKDTGQGIARDRQEAIFERFVQADIADKMALQGAGLGLSITKAYVEMLGGEIWLESEEGAGSTFYFTLPIATGLKK